MEIKLEKINNNYLLRAENNKSLGYFILDIDGSYYIRFEELSGYWTAQTLKEITRLLDDVNEPFNKQVIDYFAELREKQNNCEHSMAQDSDWDGHIENNQTCSKCGYTNH